jgi:hypothetical protein
MSIKTRLDRLEKQITPKRRPRIIMIQDETDTLPAFYWVDGIEHATPPDDITWRDYVMVNRGNIDWRTAF